MPVPHHSVFTGPMPFLPPNQQRQSTEGNCKLQSLKIILADSSFSLQALAVYNWLCCSGINFDMVAFAFSAIACSALTLLVGQQGGHPASKKTEWLGSGVVICLERGADLHMAQLMPLPLTVSCFIKIQISFTFLIPANPGIPRKRAVKWVYVCIYVCST